MLKQRKIKRHSREHIREVNIREKQRKIAKLRIRKKKFSIKWSPSSKPCYCLDCSNPRYHSHYKAIRDIKEEISWEDDVNSAIGLI